MGLTPSVKLVNILITAALVMIGFRVSEHNWLISLLGGYVITAFAPIALLAWAIVIYHFIGRGSRPGGYALRVAWTGLFLYVSTASVSTFVHEPTLDTTMTQLAYIWSPVLIFASLLWLPALNPDFRFDCGTFAHPISRHALIFAGSARGTPPEWVAPCG